MAGGQYKLPVSPVELGWCFFTICKAYQLPRSNHQGHSESYCRVGNRLRVCSALRRRWKVNPGFKTPSLGRGMFANFIKLNGFRLMAWVGQTVKRQSIESISKLMFCHVKSKVSSTLVWRNVVASLTISIVTHGESRLDALYYFKSEQNSKTNQINFFFLHKLPSGFDAI